MWGDQKQGDWQLEPHRLETLEGGQGVSVSGVNGDLRGFTVEGAGGRGQGRGGHGSSERLSLTLLCSATQGSGRSEALPGVASLRPGAIPLQDEGPTAIPGPAAREVAACGGGGRGWPGSRLFARRDAASGILWL